MPMPHRFDPREGDTFADILGRAPTYHYDDCALDREYYAAMRHNGISERAEKYGRSFKEQEQVEITHENIVNIVQHLQTIVKERATNRELQAATDAHLAAQPRGPVQEGKKRPCRHNTTQKERGWEPHWRIVGFICFRCGQDAPGVPMLHEPTPTAMRAAVILANVGVEQSAYISGEGARLGREKGEYLHYIRIPGALDMVAVRTAFSDKLQKRREG